MGTRRKHGVRARLLGLVLIPSIGLGSIVVQEVVERRRAAEAADDLVQAVDATVEALQTFVAVADETRLSAVVTEARRLGVPSDLAADVLGVDLFGALDGVRADLDRDSSVAALLEPLGGREALRGARLAVDAGNDRSTVLYDRLGNAASDVWYGALDRLAELDQEYTASGALHQALDTLDDAAALQRHTTTQLIVAARDSTGAPLALGGPDIDMATAIARVDAAVGDLLESVDGHLRADVEAISADRRFTELAAGLSDVKPTGFDVEAIGGVFAAGLERDADVRELTLTAAADARTHAVGTGRSARADYERGLAGLIGVVIVSMALAILVGRSIARPLSRLERRARDISDGDLDGEPLPLDGPREAAVLASTLNEAVANLRVIEQQAAALASGDLAGASETATHGKLSALLHRSVDGLARSMRDRESLRRRLQHEADHDALTGLANRRAAIAGLERMLAEPGPPVALLFFDVDDFKRVNDQYGHPAGDAVLRSTAERLVVGAPADALVARLGGDEFVLATRLGGKVVATELADHLQQELGRDVVVDGLPVRFGASVGIAEARPGDSADDVLRLADVALYQAKRSGRGLAVTVDDALRAEVRDSQRLDEELRAAIAADELELHYQPVVAATTGALVGVEALVRWRRPDGTLVPPDQFVPIAERTGAIAELDSWVLHTAAHQLAAWRAGPFPGLRVAVNASARTLLSNELVGDVADAIRAAGLEADALELEVTETALLHDLEAAARTIGQLHDLGVRTAIDDFGIGYTSIAQLRRLPVDQVKIDRSFVAGMGDDRDRTLVELVVRIGHVLGVEVVAEGVETDAQADALRELGCELLQGYLLGRPMPAADLESAYLSV